MILFLLYVTLVWNMYSVINFEETDRFLIFLLPSFLKLTQRSTFDININIRILKPTRLFKPAPRHLGLFKPVPRQSKTPRITQDSTKT